MLALPLGLGACGSGKSGDDDSAGAGTGGTSAAGGSSGTSAAGTSGNSGSGASGGTTGGSDGGGANGGTGGSGGTSAGRGGSAGQTGGGSSGSAGSGMLGDCGDAPPADAGWIAIDASVSGLGSGPMDSPILRCDNDGTHFAVLAKGTESDGVDATIMRVMVDGYTGAGTYSGASVRADVYHSDVGGFTAAAGASCHVCIGADERSGTYTCSGLTPWTGSSSDTLDVVSGAFTCPASNVDAVPTGGTCTPFRCSNGSQSGICAELEPKCAGGVCVKEPGKVAYCGAECDGDSCPSGTACTDATSYPARACTGAGECGDDHVDIGEQCDEPPPADHCAKSGCVACMTRSKRPGWIDLTATVDGHALRVNDFVGQLQPDCLRSVGWNGYTDGLSASIPSCDPAADYLLRFSAPVTAGTYPLDGLTIPTSDLCVYAPNTIHLDEDILVYCAFERNGTPDPAEMGSVTVDEATCGQLGARGHIEGHLVYKRTILADTQEQTVDPAHAGDGLDVSADFDLVPWDTSI